MSPRAAASSGGKSSSGKPAVGRRSAGKAPGASSGGVSTGRGSGGKSSSGKGAPADGDMGGQGLELLEEERRGRFSSSLQAGLAILNCFSAQKPVLGIAKLADELNMSRSTTHRYASTLVALGYLEQDHARRYRLAPRVADMGMSVLDSMALRGKAREPLRELREQTGRTASLAVLDGTQVRYVDRRRGWRRGQHAVDLDLGAGASLPAQCTAMGKVLLAHLPDRERARVIGELELTRPGPNSIPTKKALRAELDRVREEGIALGDEELAPGVRTIAAPVHGPDGEVIAAVGVPVPAADYTLDDLRSAFGPSVLATAERITAALRS
ncbi:MAG TPA: IclR family transcriptional regulator [Solirubrobacteraceae bacterium]|jgi:IclR family pca regulon transcriptional regulator|nr:IclR family transcriptional regulator [Solirubrobacteraceae bacterium]